MFEIFRMTDRYQLKIKNVIIIMCVSINGKIQTRLHYAELTIEIFK